MSWWRWTCSERGACSFNLPRPSSLWAEETLFLSVFTFFWGLFTSPTIFAETGQQPTCHDMMFFLSSRTIDFFYSFLRIYLWLAETSQQPISQTTWLKVTPHCNHFLSLWIYLWLTKTSQQPISQTTWLKVTPHCNHCNLNLIVLHICYKIIIYHCHTTWIDGWLQERSERNL